MYPAEYCQPLLRKTFINCPMVSGYVAARLRAEDQFAPVISGTGTTATSMLLTFENVGGTAFSVRVRETDDRSTDGIRYNITDAVSVVVGGSTQKLASNVLSYLEICCADGGPGQLRLQIESMRQWRMLGFDRTETGYYPATLWQAKVQPTAI